MWGDCADAVIESGVGELYLNAVHFRDRHVGAKLFEEKLGIKNGMFCVPHILRNIVQHRAQRGEKTLEKNVGKLDIFRLVESESQDIFIERMNKFGLKYPNAMEYLKQIPPYRWVHFAQVQSKAATFGWRSNNIGEIGQGNVLCTFRKCHPIDFMSQLMQKVNTLITKEAAKHVVWQAQDHLNPIRQMVPHGLTFFRVRSRTASKMKVTLVGNGGTVKMYTAKTGAWSEHVVDFQAKSRTCGIWARDLFPCACAIAVRLKQGHLAHRFCETQCHISYHLCDEELVPLANSVRTILAPTGDDLLPISDEDFNENFPAVRLVPPPKRVKEKHGSSKRKRKEAMTSSQSRGRTKTASYACAGTSTKARKAARQKCAKCCKAGRKLVANDWHKAKSCPHEIVDVEALEFKVPPQNSMPRLRRTQKTSYTTGRPVKESKPIIVDSVHYH